MSKYNTPFFTPRAAADPGFKYIGFGATQSLLDKISDSGVPLLLVNNLFLLNEKGQLVQQELDFAEQETTNNFASGRVFFADSQGYLRQLQVERHESGYELSASHPVKPVVTKAPSFWTRVLAFFSHKASMDKIQAYNEAMEFNNALNSMAGKEEFRHINLNPPEAEYQEETLEPDPEPVKAPPPKKVELNRTMSDLDFRIRLKRESNYTQKDFDAVLKKKDVTSQEIQDAHINLVKADIARRINAIHDVNLAHAQHTYLELTNGMNYILGADLIGKIDTYLNKLQTGNDDEIATARAYVGFAQMNNGVADLIEHKMIWHYEDEYFCSITEQMKKQDVKSRAYDAMRNREKYMEEQERKAAELEQFKKDLPTITAFTVEDVQAVVTGEEWECDDYLDALTRLMIAKVAKMLLADKKIDLKAAKPVYDALVENIEVFVADNYRQDAYDVHDTLKDEGIDAAIEQSKELIKKVTKTGLGELLTQLKKEEPNNKTYQALQKQLDKPSAEKAPTGLAK